MGKSDKKIGKGVSLPESTWLLIDEISKVLQRSQPWIFENAIQDFAQKNGVELPQEKMSFKLEVPDDLAARYQTEADANGVELSEWLIKKLQESSH